ncbi:hybrid-cluster NAD(P)-dependent oxidoreductase [Mesorhizobium sp. DCY119]|uniref:hybrid-cluster NAD(P)-dependent oxidoreductase n=1 Tax=Mesorhizobium sp. DCY119 TaxID=2108445 RepID=UPI000E72B83A|nr:hybrid-cluster NAD(P)-dependent oxidoreductase [Mesorhizobium sp. DCY119]RJG40496.1 hybrid-cluster NAD(P)-dependent oxidoreductase [Mesorhizobium sp. DCY119]
MVQLRCISVRQETPDAKTYSFRREDGGRLIFDAGQFLTFVFPIGKDEHLRSYSISSSALAPGRLSITVKRVQGGIVSHWLFDNMAPGMRVMVHPPAGRFCCGLEPARPVLLLTAGSGITPAASMLRSLADHGSEADLVLVHFANSGEQMIFAEEMGQWARALPRLRVIPVVTRHTPCSGWVGPVGRISGGLLAALVPDLAMRGVYCCGPSGFMKEAEVILSQLGLPSDLFTTESFEPAVEQEDVTSPSSDVVHMIQFAKSGRSVEVDADTTVLKAAKSAKVHIQTSCGKGACGTCRVKLLSGTVDIRHQGGILRREIDRGFILACCSRPTSDLVIER